MRLFAVAFISVLVGSQSFAQAVFTANRTDHLVPAQCRNFRVSYFSEFQQWLRQSKPANRSERVFTISLVGARKANFTHEYEMRRQDADPLWHFFRRFIARERKAISQIKDWSPVLPTKSIFHQFYELVFVPAHDDLRSLIGRMNNEFEREPKLQGEAMKVHFHRMGFRALAKGYDFNNSGDVLEVLAHMGSDGNRRISQRFPLTTHFIAGGIEYKQQGGRTLGELDVIVGRRKDCKVVAIGETKLGFKLSKAVAQLNRFIGFIRNQR